MNPFKNLTVLSLEQATVLPYLTYRLVMDGVRVIRLEHPVYGDPNRMIGENFLGEERMNSYFMAINAGKEALTLNLADPDGLALFDELLVKLDVDIFATNQLPRNYEKLNIAYERLSQIKPDLIWLGVTGFGPDSNEAAYDPILQARGGLMELTGEAGGDPQVVGIPLPDMGTSEHAYGLLMKALYEREKTGQGQRIDLSMFMSTTSWLTVPITLTALGKTITRRGNTHEFFAPVSVYKTKDGFVYMAVGNDKQWGNLSQTEGFAHLAKPEYERNAGRINDVDNLNQALNDAFSKFTTTEILDKLRAIGVAASEINSVGKVMTDSLVKDNLLSAVDDKTGKQITLAPPPFMTPYLKEENRKLRFPPRFGEQNESIYGGVLGRSGDDLAALKEKGAI
jgi:crotonobetainyl-CoA:carnitine CoA-transferase CaiB-like acyl-CoA transferase